MKDTFSPQSVRTSNDLPLPIIQVWDGVLVLPLLGALDANQAQDLSETLLRKIVETGSGVVILDVTGVPSIEAGAAKSLVDTVSAARLLGSDVLIVGLHTRTALTFVHLGVDPAQLPTETTVARGMRAAFARVGLEVVARKSTIAAQPGVAITP